MTINNDDIRTITVSQTFARGFGLGILEELYNRLKSNDPVTRGKAQVEIKKMIQENWDDEPDLLNTMILDEDNESELFNY